MVVSNSKMRTTGQGVTLRDSWGIILCFEKRRYCDLYGCKMKTCSSFQERAHGRVYVFCRLKALQEGLHVFIITNMQFSPEFSL